MVYSSHNVNAVFSFNFTTVLSAIDLTWFQMRYEHELQSDCMSKCINASNSVIASTAHNTEKITYRSNLLNTLKWHTFQICHKKVKPTNTDRIFQLILHEREKKKLEEKSQHGIKCELKATKKISICQREAIIR